MQLPDFQLEIFFSRWEFAARHNLAASDARDADDRRAARERGPRGLRGAAPLLRADVEQAGVILLPADVFTSELGEVPGDRFRLGAGRRDPAPALEALGGFL